MNAGIADSPEAIVSDVPVLFLNLFESPGLSAVLEGGGGVLEGDCRGKVCRHDTNYFEHVSVFHEIVRSHGGLYIEPTILGSIIPASKAGLAPLVAGDKSAYDSFCPIFGRLARTYFIPEGSELQQG
jgi:3-hydroxyisobutyrate dehydrogenase-like beta-hydroxyacid dehydrogenase